MALKILLADDSPHAQRDGSRILTELGYEVVAVSHGAAALEQLEQTTFDLVIADTSMPGLTGLEVCERVRQRPEWAAIPVLLAVAAFELYDAGQGRRVGADEVIQKPFIPSALERVVQQLLAKAGKTAPPGGDSSPTPSAAGATPPEPVWAGPERSVESGAPWSPTPPPAVDESTTVEPTATAPAPEPEPTAPEPAPPAAIAPETAPTASESSLSGRPRWQIEALEVVTGTDGAEPAAAVPDLTPVPDAPLAHATTTVTPDAPPAGPPATPLPGTWLSTRAETKAETAPASTTPPAEPEDLLISAWREAIAAAPVSQPQVELTAAVNAVDEVLAQYLAPIIAGEASDHIARRLRALAR
ncbi:MAG: response regulator [Terriglobales bacterium]